MFHRATFVLASALAGYGAYYTYSSNSAAAPDTADMDASTRRVVVIGDDVWGMSKVPIEALTGPPNTRYQLADGRKVVEALTPEQTTERLRQTEESYLVNRGQGVYRYDLVQIPSNSPIEDDHTEQIIEIPGSGAKSDWMFWGVFDGHS